jgi:hypothetical protein
MSRAVTGLVLLVSLMVMANPLRACDDKPPPPGAIALGSTQVVFDICPRVSDISADGEPSEAKFYRGVWWENDVPDLSVFSNNPDGSLAIPYPAGLATVPRRMVPGSLPLLAGNRAFFVEFEVSLSDDNPDHFPAVWLMPIEHNLRQEDSYPPDQRGFERWLEIDVDEGGFTPGPMATAIGWSGIWPHYQRSRSNPNLHNKKMDRAQRHRFGAGFDPSNLTITYWYDDRIQYTASGESVPEVAKKQHFYLIMNTNSQGRHLPFTMNLYRVRAFMR